MEIKRNNCYLQFLLVCDHTRDWLLKFGFRAILNRSGHFLKKSNKKINIKIADPRHRHLLFYFRYDIRRKSIRLHSQSSSITISPHFGQIERVARIEFWKARLTIRPRIIIRHPSL